MTDEHLKKHFAALRDAESDALPSYAQVLTSDRAAPPARRTLGWMRVALPAIAFIALLVWFAPSVDDLPSTASPEAFSPVRWAMPTDVLLTTPGSELMREIPALGSNALLPDPLLQLDSTRGSQG